MIIQPYSDTTLTPTLAADVIAAYPCMKRWWVHDRGVAAGLNGSWTDQIAGEVVQATGTITEGASGLYGNCTALNSTTDRTLRFSPPVNKFLFYYVVGKAITGQALLHFDYAGTLSGELVAAHAFRATGVLTTQDAAGADLAATAGGAAVGTGTIATGNYVSQGSLVNMAGNTTTRILADATTASGMIATDLTSNAGAATGTFNSIATLCPYPGESQAPALVALSNIGTYPLGANSSSGWVSQCGIMQFATDPGITFLQAALAWMASNPNKLYPGLKGKLA